MVRKALITGILGQDGSYLAEFLHAMGYEVHGIVRRSSNDKNDNKKLLEGKVTFHNGDMIDGGNLEQIIKDVMPDEVYNLAAQSHVGLSFEMPEYTFEVNALGAIKLINAILKVKPDIRYYQASTSEMFGKTRDKSQNEDSVFYPRSPYGVAKLAAHWATVNAREAHSLHASCGILFNHESERRPESFVTRKITKAIARICAGKQNNLYLGNLNSRRDWGYAGDYVKAMYLMLQQDKPGDFVISTGETHSIRDFLDEAFGVVGMDWKDYVISDKKLWRPADVEYLSGDSSKAREVLKWEPRTRFKELVELMVTHDL